MSTEIAWNIPERKALPVLLRIENTPRPYAWGSLTAISELLGTRASGGPEAELWLGDHPGSPSRVVTKGDGLGGAADLHDLLTERGTPLPFLLKVLAAEQPLSLQAHPTIEQACEGFARENAAGIALDSPARNYKDELHKPELIYALSDPFIALAGFRAVTETRAALLEVADPALASLTERLVDDAALAGTVRWLLEGGPSVARVVDALTRASRRLDREGADDCGTTQWATVRRLADHYPGDPGIAVSLLMHTVVLRPGEAIYLPSGNIHSYQHGLAIEVMAASDNVLRGGLTHKNVDLHEFMNVLDARPVPLPLMEPTDVDPGVRRFEPDVVDFAMTIVEPEGARRGAVIELRAGAIVLCLAGRVTVDGAEVLERGQALFSDAVTMKIEGDGRVVIATGDYPRAE